MHRLHHLTYIYLELCFGCLGLCFHLNTTSINGLSSSDDRIHHQLINHHSVYSNVTFLSHCTQVICIVYWFWQFKFYPYLKLNNTSANTKYITNLQIPALNYVHKILNIRWRQPLLSQSLPSRFNTAINSMSKLWKFYLVRYLQWRYI
jgi:hypothetical protein